MGKKREGGWTLEINKGDESGVEWLLPCPALLLMLLTTSPPLLLCFHSHPPPSHSLSLFPPSSFAPRRITAAFPNIRHERGGSWGSSRRESQARPVQVVSPEPALVPDLLLKVGGRAGGCESQ